MGGSRTYHVCSSRGRVGVVEEADPSARTLRVRAPNGKRLPPVPTTMSHSSTRTGASSSCGSASDPRRHGRLPWRHSPPCEGRSKSPAA
jgi:hypothetical protein